MADQTDHSELFLVGGPELLCSLRYDERKNSRITKRHGELNCTEKRKLTLHVWSYNRAGQSDDLNNIQSEMILCYCYDSLCT